MDYGARAFTTTTLILSQCLLPLLAHSGLVELLRSFDICHRENFVTLFELVPEFFVGDKLRSIEEASLFYVSCYEPSEVVFEIEYVHLLAPEHSASL